MLKSFIEQNPWLGRIVAVALGLFIAYIFIQISPKHTLFLKYESQKKGGDTKNVDFVHPPPFFDGNGRLKIREL